MKSENSFGIIKCTLNNTLVAIFSLKLEGKWIEFYHF